MESVSSRIWTRIVVYNSYDDNHYTTGTSSLKLALWNNKRDGGQQKELNLKN